MPTTPWVPMVTLVTDGQQVSAETINPILDQLIQREEYLYEQFANANDLSVLTAFSQPIHPDELADGVIVSGNLLVGYFANDDDGSGVRRAVVSLSTSATQSLFTPNNSSYPFGIINNVSTNGTVDLWLSGLITFPINIDDPTNGLTQPTGVGTVEAFKVGPYYLSQSTPGKITANPSGIAVFVGYGISETQFLLNPSVNQLSQLFTTYQFNLIDRPTAVPVLLNTSGSNGVANGTTTFTSTSASFASSMIGHTITISGVNYTITAVASTHSVTLSSAVTAATGLTFAVNAWTIPNSDMTRLGWVDVVWLQANDPSALTGYVVPAGAKYLYNVPQSYATDDADNSGAGSIDQTTQTDNTDLVSLIPPTPADFSLLTVNGVIQTYRDTISPYGLFTIDSYGIWWYDDNDTTQPWSSELASSWAPANWPTNKGDASTRPYIFLRFTRFNPTFGQSIVTSLAPFNDGTTNNSSNMLALVDKKTGLPAMVGDLLAKLNIVFATDVTVTASPTALATVTYNQVTGQMVRTVTPVISTLTGLNGVTVVQNPANSGNYQISFQSQGITGQVYDLEPENAFLDYLGTSLHSYLHFPYSGAAITYGVVGKIVLPEQFPYGQPLYIVLHLFGFSNVSGNNSIGFNFSYNVSTVVNGVGPTAVLAANSTSPNNTLLPNDTVGVSSPLVITLPSGYVAQQPYKYKNVALSIPAANIGPDSIVNFRLTRNILAGTDYGADIGLLAVYWSIAST